MQTEQISRGNPRGRPLPGTTHQMIVRAVTGNAGIRMGRRQGTSGPENWTSRPGIEGRNLLGETGHAAMERAIARHHALLNEMTRRCYRASAVTAEGRGPPCRVKTLNILKNLKAGAMRICNQIDSIGATILVLHLPWQVDQRERRRGAECHIIAGKVLRFPPPPPGSPGP